MSKRASLASSNIYFNNDLTKNQRAAERKLRATKKILQSNPEYADKKITIYKGKLCIDGTPIQVPDSRWVHNMTLAQRSVSSRYLSSPIVTSSICEHPASRETERNETKRGLTMEWTWILFQRQLPFNGQYLTNHFAINFTRLKFAHERHPDIFGSGSYRESRYHSF